MKKMKTINPIQELIATQAMNITYGCGHYQGIALGDAIHDRCLECYPPPKLEVGDIQIDPDGSEWVIVSITTRNTSRVRRYSEAHRVHADVSPVIAESLKEDD